MKKSRRGPSERDGDPGTDSFKERPLRPNSPERLPIRSVVDRDLRVDRGVGLRADAENALHLLLDFGHQRRIVLEIHLRILTALTDTLRPVAIPRARLVDDVGLGRDIED